MSSIISHKADDVGLVGHWDLAQLGIQRTYQGRVERAMQGKILLVLYREARWLNFPSLFENDRGHGYLILVFRVK